MTRREKSGKRLHRSQHRAPWWLATLNAAAIFGALPFALGAIFASAIV